MVRFEWAQAVAFDGRAKPPVTPDDILDTPPSKLRLAQNPKLEHGKKASFCSKRL